MTESFASNRKNQTEENVKRFLEKISLIAQKAGRNPDDITVMAVTKTVPAEIVNTALVCGIRVIGENRVQEFLEKEPLYDLKGKAVHFIGTLQRNKVKYIASKVDRIESVSSFKLAQEIDRQCGMIGKLMPVLIEVNIGGEESKTGADIAALEELLYGVSALPNLSVKGLMAIPPASGDYTTQRRYCAEMYKLFIDIKSKRIDNINMECLSMGMSGDYVAAIEEGSTEIRIGTALFGGR